MFKSNITALFLALSSIGLGQITNDGAIFFVQPGGIVYSEGNIQNENFGTFDNSGDIYLEGDWINNGGNTALINSSQGRVTMTGGNQQISGTDLTLFYNLRLDGGVSMKAMLIDTETENELDLMDAELQTNNNIMYFTNTDKDSIVWNTGYVSSNDLGGYLSRATNSTDTYVFPVGSSALPGIYRAVDVTPTATNANSYAVRLAVIDPTYDNSGTSASGANGGFDKDVKDPLLDEINDQFYHNIIRLTGNDPASVNIYYFTFDGTFDEVAQWDGTSNQWENAQYTNVATSGNFSIGNPNMVATRSSLNNFNHDLFALTSLFKDVRIPEFISPNGDGKNDVLIIDNIGFYPNNKLQVFNRYGNIVFEKNNYQNQWNGSANISKGINTIFNGKGNNPLPSGTYYYILDLGVDELNPYVGYLQIQK